MSTDVVVKLDAAATGERRERALAACARELGVTLTALHENTTDRELASYFIATFAAASDDAMLARLRRCPGVDAAYAKPQGVPPGRT
jgi:hypothetical protein